jgi:hypothetical protein
MALAAAAATGLGVAAIRTPPKDVVAPVVEAPPAADPAGVADDPTVPTAAASTTAT